MGVYPLVTLPDDTGGAPVSGAGQVQLTTMQHSKFTLADKVQYVTKILGHQQIIAGDLERYVFQVLKASNDFTDEDSEIIDRWFQPLRDALIQSQAAIYEVLNASDAKRAIAVVKGLQTGRGSKRN